VFIWKLWKPFEGVGKVDTAEKDKARLNGRFWQIAGTCTLEHSNLSIYFIRGEKKWRKVKSICCVPIFYVVLLGSRRMRGKKTTKTTSIMETIKNAYSSVVGQSRLISNRILAHSAWAMGNDAPTSLLLTGAAGLGKTHFLRADLAARAAAVEIRREREAETLFLRSPQEIRLAGDAYFDAVESFQNGDGVALDEIHEIDISPTVQTRKLRAILKGLLVREPGQTRRVKLDDDTEISRHVSDIYIAAGTNYPEKIKDGPALISRFGGETPLALYSTEDLTKILLIMTASAGLRIAENTISLVAKCGRGTARPLEAIVSHLAAMAIMAGKETLNRADILAAMRALELFPLGVSKREVSILVRAKGAGIAARMIPILWAIEPKASGQSVAFLASLGFVSLRAGDVTLTPTGAAYLDHLKAEKFTVA
jgi:Holliday junction resolvasome RuvABC ATP-dependent DNA helicase subunit